MSDPLAALKDEKPKDRLQELVNLETRLSTLEERLKARQTFVEQLVQKAELLEEKDQELNELEKRALTLLIARLER